MNKKGFTLSEVIVSLVIIGIVMSTAVTIYLSVFSINHKSDVRQNLANHLNQIFVDFEHKPTTSQTLYFDNDFLNQVVNENDYNYLELTVSEDGNYDILVVKAYVRGELYTFQGKEEFTLKVLRNG